MSETQASVTPPPPQLHQAASSEASSQLWFACCCIALPVLWGVVVHLIFRRLRKEGQPEREQQAGWPDYQI
jgi:uncharacterized membrane protein YhdT